MVKVKSTYVCQQCMASYPKWSGRCESCGEWNSLVEQANQASGASAVSRSAGKVLNTKPIGDISSQEHGGRLGTGLDDLNDVLGGGVLPGSVILLAGQPGIGKSTLLLQVTSSIAKTASVLYVSGEESASQVKMRATRIDAVSGGQLEFVASTNADDIAATIAKSGHKLVVVDSIQTLSMNEISSAPGSVSQITNSANLIIRSAKYAGAAVILVGHVTKEGAIAGPKVLEHLVDVVLQFEGDRYGGFKMVRAAKNRFGGTNEVAIFEMSEKGLELVSNPSESLLAERQNVDGSVVLATVEGTRSLLVEIQALVTKTNYGYPKRTASGFDINRLNLLIAVVERRTKLNLSDKDIFINVVGGLRLSDPAADLAVCMAIASAASGRKVPDDVVICGEVGLGGEVRHVVQLEKRIAEAKKLGFKKVLCSPTSTNQKIVQTVKSVREALINYVT
jgi:DNA repair protein RadA/Sms